MLMMMMEERVEMVVILGFGFFVVRVVRRIGNCRETM